MYARSLTRLLAAVDRFFGDAGQQAPAWQRRLFFGLRAGAPLWSAPAYDRCLLLALVYPLGVLYFGWVLSNHIGPVEQALGFDSAPQTWRRLLGLLALMMAAVLGRWFALAYGIRQNLLRGAAFILAVTGAGAGAGVVAVVVAGFVADEQMTRRGHQAAYLVAFSLVVLGVCAVGPVLLARPAREAK